MENRRSIRNLFRRPSKQLSALLAIFLGAAFAICVTVISVLISMSMKVHELSNRYMLPPELPKLLEHSLMTGAIVMIVAGAVMIVSALGISVTLGQKVFAPMVPIKRLIAKLQNGDYRARGQLRKGDEFQDLMTDLNTLAKRLEERHGQQI